jgi:uncharacterized protein (TIGR02246 family)
MDDLVNLETQFWTAIKERDAEALARLTDDECIVTGAQGAASLDRKTVASMITGAPWRLQAFELKDAKVRLVRDDVAIVAYQVHESLTVEGKPLELDAADASVWVRCNGAWMCALHTESLSGDPFGRDRR